MQLLLIIILVVSTINFWFFNLLKYNPILTIILLIESILLFFAYLKFKSKKVFAVVILILLLYLSLYSTKDLNKNIFFISNLDEDKIATYQRFYGDLGKIYKNRFGVLYFNELEVKIIKFNNKLFENFEAEQYISRYPAMFSILFLIGLGRLLVSPNSIILIYLITSLFVTSFLHIQPGSGRYLLFPFINFSIAVGVLQIIKMASNRFKLFKK